MGRVRRGCASGDPRGACLTVRQAHGRPRAESRVDWKPYIRPHLTALSLSATREIEIIDELAQHLDERWRELIARGTSEWVAPDYFATVGVPILQGREFRSSDRTGTIGVAVVNEALARRFWPGQDPIGKSLSYAGDADLQVVGLVKDHRARTPSEQPRPALYLPYLQRYQATLTLVARTNRDAGGYGTEIRNAARSLDPAVLPYNVRTLTTEKERSLAGARYAVEISTVFGILCLVVSGVGLYGVLAQAVARRTREIALRMALGASRSRTVGLVVRDAMVLVAVAFVPGTISALAAGQLLKSMLYETAATDAVTVSAAVVCLTLAALVAAWRPASWAANVDPIVALREE